ncbi:uncharacterized protein LOC135708047 [Ochlerotatus camptorhynchus]|uniref:uncharacterized protein LOC135708047 n=1 Tax=Ochlerotatus camptorhynchus TaxID=644619 RepID=UPI0031D8ABC2
MMRQTFVLLTFASFASFLLACDHPIKHYITMGCIPSEQKTDKGCPLSYDCPNLTNRQKDKCYLLGKVYDINENVPSEETSEFCTALVSCNVGNEGRPAAFIHAHIDCPEFFRPREPDCVHQFQPSSCCSSGKVCGDDRAKLATCSIGDKSFREGEQMHISDKPCQTCICSAEFDLTKTEENANCYENRCSFEIHEVDKLYGGGAPVYKDGYCCPWFWRLPKETDKVKVESNNLNRSDHACKYGNLTLGIGDSLETIKDNQETIQCTCAIPPLVYCRTD